MIQLYSIEGNIGSGKSTLLKECKKHMNSLCLCEYSNDYEIIFLQEPVDSWMGIKDGGGETILSKFYNDKEKYAFSFQMMAYISRLDLLKKIHKQHKNCIIISERSVHTDKYVFAKMLYDDGIMEDVNYQIYNNWFDSFIDEIDMKGVIYLDVDPEKCKERVEKRNREGETIDMGYLKLCKQYHDEYVNKFNNIVLNGNDELEKNKDTFIKKISEFIYKNIQ